MTLAPNKVTAFTFRHQDQADKPAFASSAAFKLALDSQAAQLQTGLNGLIDALMNALAGTSGAEQIGSAPIAGLNGATPYAQIADLITKVLTVTNTTVYTPTQNYNPSTKKYVDDVAAGFVLGQIPDVSLTLQKLSQALQTSSIGGQIYAYKNMGGF